MPASTAFFIGMAAMWDGGVNHLDMQPLSPISSRDEMDETMENVVRKLNNDKKYRKLYQLAFGDSLVTGQRTLQALSQFMLMLNSYNSKYDHFIRKEPGGTFSEKTLDARLQTPSVLSPTEKIDLVAFLLTLTDKEFLFDSRFGFPRE